MLRQSQEIGQAQRKQSNVYVGMWKERTIIW